MQNHRRGLQVGEPPCGKGSGCRFGCASAPIAFRRQRQAKQRQSRMPGPPLLLKCPGARQADKARCRESKLVAIAQEDMGGQWGAKAIVASPGRGQQPKDFPQAETLQAGQLVNQASWGHAGPDEGGTSEPVFRPLPEPETRPTAFPKETHSADGIGLAR